MTNQITPLLNKTIEHASFFLKEYKEFYPFAIVRKKGGVLTPLNIFEGDDHPSSTHLLQELERLLESGFEKYEYDAFAIGIDVTVTRFGQKHDAIQIKLNWTGEYYEDCFVPYEVKESSVELFDVYTSES